MSWIGLVLGLGAALLLGAGVTAAVAARAPGARRDVPLHLAAGTAVLAWLGSLALIAGLPLSLAAVYLLLAALLPGLVRRLREPRPPRPAGAGPDPLARVLVAGTVGVLAVQLIAAARDRLWWDGWAIWGLKARVLFHEGGFPARVLDPAGPYAFTHPDYPPLVPLWDWWAMRHFGAADPAAVSLVGAFWFAMVVALLGMELRRHAGNAVAALAALCLALFWPLYFFASGGTADVVLAFAFLGAVASLHRLLETNAPGEAWRAAVFLSVAALTKNEGLAFALLATGGTALTLGLRRGTVRAVPAALALPLLAAAPWFTWARLRGLQADHLADSFRPSVVAQRLPSLLEGLATLAATPTWTPVVLLAALGLASAARRGRLSLLAPWGLVVGYFVIICSIYAQAPQDLGWLLVTSLTRVLGALVPASVYLALASTVPEPAPIASPRSTEDRALTVGVA